MYIHRKADDFYILFLKFNNYILIFLLNKLKLIFFKLLYLSNFININLFFEKKNQI